MKIPLIYSIAKVILKNDCILNEPWELKKPVGITIHYSADRNLNSVLSWIQKEKLGYHCIIDSDGEIYQICPFDKRVNHAGNSLWNDKSPNRNHIAICLMSFGLLTKSKNKYLSWNNVEINPINVALRNDLNGNQHLWDKATDIQESSLLNILSWLVSYGINPDEICGHDECCIPKGRKIDPGGIISLTLDQIRKLLKSYIETELD